MNFDAMGKAIGWLPGAGIGTICGVLLAAMTFDSAAERCPVGGSFSGIGGVQTQLFVQCVQSPVGDLSMGEYLAAMGVLGAAIGILVNLAVVSAKGQEA